MRAVLPFVCLLWVGCQPSGVTDPGDDFVADPADPATGDPPDPTTEPEPDPVLRLESPSAGSWRAPGPMDVSVLAVGHTDVRLDGELLTLDEDGRATVVLEVEAGIRTVELTAVHPDGLPRVHRHSVLAGTWADPDLRVQEAVLLRANQAGLDAIAEVAVPDFPAADIEADLMAANPLYASTVADLYAESFTYDRVEVALDPTPGVLQVTVSIHSLAFGLYVDTLFDLHETLTVGRIDVQAPVVLSAVGGQPRVDVGGLGVTLTDLDASVLPDFDWVEEAVADAVSDALVDVLDAEVPAIVAAMLGDIDLSTEVDVLGVMVAIEPWFATIETDDDGVALTVDLAVSTDVPAVHMGAGYLAADRVAPILSHSEPVVMALHDDVPNLLLYEAWRAGLLDMTLSTADGTLPTGDLGPLDLDEGTVVITPVLPVVTLGDGEMVAVEVGELWAEVVSPGAAFGERLLLAADARITAAPYVHEGALTVDLAPPEIELVVRESDWHLPASGIGAIVEAVLPVDLLVGEAEGFTFPLPTLEGVSVEDVIVYRSETDVHTIVEASIQ